jgi:hypothetical protein
MILEYTWSLIDIILAYYYINVDEFGGELYNLDYKEDSFYLHS